MGHKTLVQEITIEEFFDWETGERTFELRRMECHEPCEIAEREIEISNRIRRARKRRNASLRVPISRGFRERIKALASFLAWPIGRRHD